MATTASPAAVTRLSRLWSRNPVLLTALLATVALSAISIWTLPRVNTDAILYLIAADAWLDSGLAASMEVYNWPFFHIAFAALHQLTGLPLLWAARLLMTGCFLALTVAFWLVTRELGADRRTQWFALLVILCHPEINEHRANLVRDPGMLAFLLLALWQQLRFAASGRWRNALLWAANIGIAALFRMEALAIALLAPGAMLLLPHHPWRRRLALAGKLLTLPAAAVTAGLLASTVLPGADLDSKLSRDLAIFSHKLSVLADEFSGLAEVLASQVLGEFSRDEAGLALFSIFATLTVAAILKAISLPYLLALAAGWLRRVPVAIGPNAAIVAGYGLIIFAYLFAFVLTERFTTTRYGLPLALLLLLPLPFLLSHGWQAAPRRRLVRGLIALLLAVNGIDSLVSGDWKKNYILDAAHWARDADQIPVGALIANDPNIAYFAGKTPRELVIRAINPGRLALTDTIDTVWLPGRVYAHRVRHGEAEQQLLADIRHGNGDVLQLFRGRDKRSVYIFTVRDDVRRSPLLLERP